MSRTCNFIDTRTNSRITFQGRDLGHLPWMRTTTRTGVVLLRDPRERLRSAFFFRGGHFLLKPVSKMRWKGNVTKYATFPGVSGCQTKMLLGFECFDSSNSTVELVHSIDGQLQALEVLMSDFLFFGLTDEFSLSVDLYNAMFGRPETPLHWTAYTKVRASAHWNSIHQRSSEDVMLEIHEAGLMSWEPDALIYSVAAFLFWNRVCNCYSLLPGNDRRCNLPGVPDILMRLGAFGVLRSLNATHNAKLWAFYESETCGK
mmetsp:Transcript_109646/g.171466  ORF Transcript_109646/g.171466 Transcript_109646/m.171466 type:complete len:259 (+) Transcript_109646:3-779(+)